MTHPTLQHVEAMRVRQSKIHEGDTKFYIETANGFVVRGPFSCRDLAEVALKNRISIVERELKDLEPGPQAGLAARTSTPPSTAAIHGSDEQPPGSKNLSKGTL